MRERTYIAIDLKSFYASVECVARGLDPLTARLVVADPSRTEKTICLAVSPALKAYGIPGRARLFEVVQAARKYSLDYIVAPPRMSEYMKISSAIYRIYQKYAAPEDIHVYSVDEVFIDATSYIKAAGCSAHEYAMRMIRDVLEQTGITATAGIGTNLYLAKIAMDIEAKHCPADSDGVRIAELDEMSYRRKYWSHQPLTDFWRIGKGLSKRLEANGMRTMGDIARRSVTGEGKYSGETQLYKLFGVNAEILIDHAWGWEPCTIADIKSCTDVRRKSLSSGQVLSEPYTYEKAKVVIKEMADKLSMDLVRMGLVVDQMVLNVGYDISGSEAYGGEIVMDHYGRPVPKPAHGSANLGTFTSSSSVITDAVSRLFDRITDRRLMIRRMSIAANHTVDKSSAGGVQLDLFAQQNGLFDTERERRCQDAILSIRSKYGNNAILKGLDFEDGATTRERNSQIGGHKA